MLVAKQGIENFDKACQEISEFELIPENHKYVTHVEKEHTLKMLQETGWHRGQAAKLLGIDRKTPRTKMRKHRVHGNSGHNSSLLGKNAPRRDNKSKRKD